MRVLACLLERLRLADGPHGCAGRLEVWHTGRWGTVCDDGWDLRDAAVACRELGCGGALAAPGGAFFGEGVGPVWLSELACRGSERQLGLCPHRGWKAHICSHEEDAGVVCAGQRVADSRDQDNTPSILDGDPWPGLSGELSPGSEEPPVTHAPRPAGTPQNSSRKKSSRPPKQAKSTRAPLLTAGAPRQERLRLVSGPHGCSGRLEVWHGGRWGTVCDDGWDLRDAAVACRELGCGGALAAPGGARFGPGSGPVWMDDVGVLGHAVWGAAYSPAVGADHLFRPRNLGRKLATLPATHAIGSPRLRLVAGPSRCSGRLEVWHAGRWGTVCDDSWDLRDTAVVCRELGCGGPRQPDPAAGRFGWGAGPIWLDDVRCTGTEASLANCPAAPWGKHNCAHNEDVGITCTGTPGLDSISDPFSWSWIPGLGRDPDAWLPGELATKPPARLTPSVLEKTTKAPGKMPKSTKKWVTKTAKRPATQPPVMPTTKHSRVQGTRSPLELTLRTTTARTMEASRRPTSEFTTRLTTETSHTLTSHTPVTRTPRAPRERTFKTVATPTTQGPQEMTSEATVEPSARIPEGSPESSKDPAPSPTGGSVGLFRVRLADGPNRCAGRLEVWHAGRWGTVCDDNWDLRDGTVACWELGCGRVRPRVGKTHYGPGTGPIWLDDLGCKGSETSLSDCPARPWGQHNCDHEEDVGLTCTGTPGYTDEEDYPPWTWDPTSGEDLAKRTTTAGMPGHILSRGTTGRPGVPSPATRRLPGTELVAAVRDVGGQLQRLTQALERDQQERQALGLGLAQLVEAAQGLGHLITMQDGDDDGEDDGEDDNGDIMMRIKVMMVMIIMMITVVIMVMMMVMKIMVMKTIVMIIMMVMMEKWS
ncbi:Soluble scavenger receptor cysteine-rich domain-containing protein SSC5D [Camelus dromedarius]|uniref:Soluble scavenger receptor cysteine-rich domain-containing protein SSC5D n=1 Tax=Camelus dromedarius TaxID=9838 RepID=A0A5N4DQT9_CAMDR|nr:Soluble scavenger receptor cysteine-rich domain-containing protein SSC5D [Camelus dromedarius]